METFDYVSLQRKIAEQPKLFETETRGQGNYADNRPRRDRARWFPSTGVRRSGGQTAEVRWSRNYRTLRGVSSRCRSREQETSKKWFWRVALLLSRGVLFLLSSSRAFSPLSFPIPWTCSSRFFRTGDFSPWRGSSSSSRGILPDFSEKWRREIDGGWKRQERFRLRGEKVSVTRHQSAVWLNWSKLEHPLDPFQPLFRCTMIFRVLVSRV